MSQHFSLIVKTRYNGLRLDQFLREVVLAGSELNRTRQEIQQLIAEGGVEVDGRQVRPSYRLKPGETVSATLDTLEPPKQELPTETIEVIFEDNQLLVINKPAGVAMHPARKGTSGTIADWLKAHYPSLERVGEGPDRPGMVHRLDKETSGIVVVAKTQAAFDALKVLFQERRIEKHYQALVYGHMPENTGEITLALGRVRGSLRRGVPEKKRQFGGNLREATTRYHVSRRYEAYDYLTVEPKTGRTHQIRVHLAALGHPVVGDLLYRFKTHRKGEFDPSHQLLHAGRLAFTLLGQEYAFEAPLPPYFEEVLQALDEAENKR